MEPKCFDEKAQADVVIKPEAVANRHADPLDVKRLKAEETFHSELKELHGVFSSLVAKFEGKREGAISCSSIKAAMPLCREAEAIRGQIEKTRIAINESRARYHASLEEIRDDRVLCIIGLCTSRGSSPSAMGTALKLLHDVCQDFRSTNKTDRVARGCGLRPRLDDSWRSCRRDCT